jgi:hypothetical protein
VSAEQWTVIDRPTSRRLTVFGKIYRSLRSLIQRPAVERDLDEEVRFHMEMEIAQHIHNSMSPDAARPEVF